MSTSRIAHADVRTPATALVSSALQRLRIGLLVVCALTGLGWSEHAAAQAAMTVFKGLSGIQIDADNNGQISVGDTLKYYTYARNDGTGNLTNVVLSDPLTTPNTFTCATVNVNGTCFFDNFFYVVTAADASAGSITNTASATSTEVPGPIASNTVNTLVFTGGTTSMTVTKQFQGILVDADGNSQVTVGDTLNYTVDAQNTGTVNLTNVVVSDPILTPNSSNCGTLTALPGNNCHLSGNYVVTAADEAAGHIINTAAATSNEVGPVPSNTVNTPVILRNPTMSVTKSLAGNPSQVAVGDVILYTIFATNTGNLPLHNVVITDPRTTPSTATCATVNLSLSCIFNGNYTVTAADATAGSISNTGSVTSTETPVPIASNTTNTPVVGGGTTSMTVSESFDYVLPSPTAGAPVIVGATARFVVDMRNTGTTTLTNVVVSDPKLTPNSITCASVIANAFCTLTGDYTVTAADGTAGSFSNTASATSTQIPGPVIASTVVTPVVSANPAMSVGVVLNSFADNDHNSLVSLGDQLFYTVTTTNTGSTPLTRVQVNDSVAALGSNCATLAVNATCVLSNSYVVQTRDVTGGAVINTGTATADGITGQVTNELATPVFGGQMVVLVRVSNADGDQSHTVTPGDVLTYDISATNYGNVVPLTNVQVSDPTITPNATSCASLHAANTGPDASCQLLGTYTVTAADLTNGSINNTGSATSNEVPGPISYTLNTRVFAVNNSITIASGDLQHVPPNTALPQPLVVLTKNGGVNASGVTVNWTVTSGTATLSAPTSVSNGSGLGQINVTLSATPGQVTIQATRADDASMWATFHVYVDVVGGQLRVSEVQPSNADGDHSGTVTVGDALTYTITATNTGSIALTNVQITDPLLTPTLANCASVAVGATCVLTGTHTVTATDAANGQIFDHPKATATQLTSSEDTAIITPVVTASGAAMSVIVNFNDFVDTDNSGTTTAGDQLHVIVTAINSGSVPLTNVQVSETQTVPNSFTCASVAVGATCVLTGTYTITAADITAANVFFTGSATSTQVPGPVSLTRDGNFNNTGPIGTFSLQKVSGDAQAGAPGTTLPIPLKVRLLGMSSTPLAGKQIDFHVVQGSAHFTNASATTDALGEASTQLVLGNTPGPVVLFASGGDAPDVLFVENITGLTTATAALTIMSGNNQSLPIDTPSAPLVVQLTSNNLPVANATINWSGTNATLTSATSLTDVNGRATNTATLPSVGAASVSASSSSPAAGPVTFSFNGSIANVGGLTPAQFAVATALDNGCAALVLQGTLTPAQQDLLRQCQALTSANPGEVRNALDQMLPHNALLQTNAGIQVATAQFDNIKARIAALRSGAHGAHFGGLAFSAPSGTLPVGTLGDSLFGFTEAKADDKQKQEVGSAFDRWGFFASGNFGRGSADPRQATPGYGFHTNGITAGVDYRFNDQLIAGVSAGYAKYSSSVDNVGGGLNTSGWSLSGYSTFFRQDSWYVDGVLTWGSNSYDIARRIIYTLTTGAGTTTVNQTAKSNSSGTTLAGAGTFGRDFAKGPWSFGPYFRGTYTRTSFGSYQEVLQSGNGNGLGLAVQSRDVTAIASVLGAKLNYASSQSWGVLMPHAEVEWEHEFRSSPDSITAHFLQDPTATPILLNGDAIDTDFFRLGLGMSFQFTGGRSGFIYYEKTLGLTGITQDNLTLGFRMEF